MENELPDFIKGFLMHITQQEEGTWVPVARLSSDDTLKRKNHDMQARRLASEGKVLYHKLQVIQATLAANKSEFWDSIYKAYNLPSDLTYKIDDDGTVLKHVPTPPTAENA